MHLYLSRLYGDIILVGGIHVPSSFFLELRLLRLLTTFITSRKTAIVGDILNGDKDSRYEHIITQFLPQRIQNCRTGLKHGPQVLMKFI